MALICVIALAVFGVLGIFSAKYRSLSVEAFDCVFRRITLRPCLTHFDQKLKMKIVGSILTRSPLAARFVFNHFEALSWAFVVVTLVTGVYSAYGLYNLWAYGNCNGPHSSEFCIFNPTGSLSCNSTHCEVKGCTCDGQLNCTAPQFAACEGNCTCLRTVCG